MSTGRPFEDLCFGAPTAGAGGFPPVAVYTPPPVPSPAETGAVEFPLLCVATPPAASASAYPVSWSEPPPAFGLR